MPPRKSNTSVASGADDGGRDGLSVEDLNLPRTMVQRLAKGVLPPNTIIQKDALLAISKSATVFVNFLASNANENAQRMNKRTIQPKDVLDAVGDMEYEAFLPRLEAELVRYNATQCDKRNTYRRKIREEQQAAKAKAQAVEGGDHAEEDPTLSSEGGAEDPAHLPKAIGTNGHPVITKDTVRTEPAAKKLRRSDGDAVAAEDSGDEDMEMGDGGQEEEEEEEEGEEDEQEEDEEDEDEEQEDEGEGREDKLVEDPLEERERSEDEDSVLGDDSD